MTGSNAAPNRTNSSIEGARSGNACNSSRKTLVGKAKEKVSQKRGKVRGGRNMNVQLLRTTKAASLATKRKTS